MILLPLVDLQSTSFAATPGGLCQLLSNPPTCQDQVSISKQRVKKDPLSNSFPLLNMLL